MQIEINFNRMNTEEHEFKFDENIEKINQSIFNKDAEIESKKEKITKEIIENSNISLSQLASNHMYAHILYLQIKMGYFQIEYNDFNNKNIISKGLYYIFKPITLLKDITIPSCIEKDWNPKMFSLTPVFGILFCIFVFKSNIFQ